MLKGGVILSISPAEIFSCESLDSLFRHTFLLLRKAGFLVRLSNHDSADTPGTLVIAYFPGSLSPEEISEFESSIKTAVLSW